MLASLAEYEYDCPPALVPLGGAVMGILTYPLLMRRAFSEGSPSTPLVTGLTVYVPVPELLS